MRLLAAVLQQQRQADEFGCSEVAEHRSGRRSPPTRRRCPAALGVRQRDAARDRRHRPISPAPPGLRAAARSGRRRGWSAAPAPTGSGTGRSSTCSDRADVRPAAPAGERQAVERRVAVVGRRGRSSLRLMRPSVGDRDALARAGLLPVAPDRHLAVAGPLARGRLAGRRPRPSGRRSRGQLVHRRAVEVRPASTSISRVQQVVARAGGDDLDRRDEREVGDRAVAGGEEDQVAAGCRPGRRRTPGRCRGCP